MKTLIKALVVAAIVSAHAYAAPIPPVGCPNCILNTASPQNAQVNLGTAVIRGTLSASTGAFTWLHADWLDLGGLSGDGAALTNLNASALASGVSPSARLVGPYTGITGVGTLTAGRWQGDPIATAYGGTGQAWGGVLGGYMPYFSAPGTMSVLAPGASGALLQANGAGAAPSWTGAPAILGTNITAIPLAGLSAGTLPGTIQVPDASLSVVSGSKVSGNIPGSAANITGTLALGQLGTGTLPSSIPASSVTATGVAPGTYPATPNRIPILVVRSDGRISSASQTDILLPLSQLNSGTLPAGVTIPATSVNDGTLNSGVIAQTLNASGVTAGTYGGPTVAAQVTVNSQGRVTGMSQFPIPGVSTQTAMRDRDNHWPVPQTSSAAWVFLAPVTAASFATTGTITGTILPSGVDLSTVTAAFYAVGAATKTLSDDLATEISNRHTSEYAIGASTLALSNRTGALENLTYTLGTSSAAEQQDRISADYAVGAATSSLRSDLTTETSNRVAADYAIGASTKTTDALYSPYLAWISTSATGVRISYLQDIVAGVDRASADPLYKAHIVQGNGTFSTYGGLYLQTAAADQNAIRSNSNFYVTHQGDVTGTSFNGSASGLTSIPAAQLAGVVPASSINGSTYASKALQDTMGQSTATLLSYINSTGSALTSEINRAVAVENLKLTSGAVPSNFVDLSTVTTALDGRLSLATYNAYGGTITTALNGKLASADFNAYSSTITTAFSTKITSPTNSCEAGRVLTSDGAGLFTCQPVGSAAGLTYMIVSAASDISGYTQIKSVANYTPAARSTITATNPALNSYISSSATNVGFPGVTQIPAGTIRIHLHCLASNSNRFKLKPELYTRTAGGLENEWIENCDITPFITTSEVAYDSYCVNLSTNIAIDTRIVQKTKFTTVGTGSVSCYVDGIGAYDTAAPNGGATDARVELPAVAASVANYVPYAGATQDLALGNHNLSTSYGISMATAVITSTASVTGKDASGYSLSLSSGINMTNGVAYVKDVCMSGKCLSQTQTSAGVAAGDNISFTGTNSHAGLETFTSTVSVGPSELSSVSSYGRLLMGGYSLVASTRPSGATQVDITGLQAGYDYEAVYDLLQSGGASNFAIRFNNDSSASYDYGTWCYNSAGVAGAVTSGTNNTLAYIIEVSNGNGGSQTYGSLYFRTRAAAPYATVRSQLVGGYHSSSSCRSGIYYGGSSVTSLNIITTGGVITGEVRLYARPIAY